MNHFKNLLYIVLLLCLILLPNCRKDETSDTAGKPLMETAEIIAHATSGVISASDPVTITFVTGEVEKDQTDTPVKKQVFFFEPPIDGIATWKNRRTLTFKPNKKLPFRTTFKCEVKFNRLLPKYKQEKPLMFSITVAGREIADIDGGFEPFEKNNPDKVVLTGNISFTEPLPLAAMKKAFSLILANETLRVTWKEIKKDKSFRFSTQPLNRPSRKEKVVLVIDKTPVELSGNFKKEFILAPLKKMEVTEIRKFDQGKNPGVEVRFSDPPSPEQDITGLIRCEPPVKFTAKTQGNSIHLAGDFAYGKLYLFKIAGIRSKWGTTLEEEAARQVTFEDLKPRMSFLSNGIYLTSRNQRKLAFKTVNVKKVKVVIKKVFESNLGYFLQGERIHAGKSRNERIYDYDLNRVGITAAEKEFHIGDTKNRWLTHLLDLEELLKPGEKGLFIVTVSFKKEDMIYPGLTKKNKYYYGRDYYKHPNSGGYLYRHGYLVKPLIVSDIGLTYKSGSHRHMVLATNLTDAAPLGGVDITLRTYQNQVAGKGKTDADGKAVFDEIKEKVFYVEAEKDGQRSMIKPSEMGWNLSSFDTGGEVLHPDETRAFIYTERGVYRPGDPVHLSVIARNKDNTFPENHPVTLEVYNPKEQLVFKKTSNKGSDGFYAFTIPTKTKDLTGNWKAKVLVGSRTFYHTLKIETVVPNRLKVFIKPEKKPLEPTDRRLIFDLASTYLFGAPAANLKAEVEVNIKHREKTFASFPGFMFNNETLQFKSLRTDVFKGSLDAAGKTHVKWQLPGLTHAPSSVSASITAKVFEKGGRFTRMGHMVPIEPFSNYVGLGKPKFQYGFSRVGAPMDIQAVLVKHDGKPAAGQPLKYKIYKNSRYWWWEYDSSRAFRIRYKKDKFTRLVKEGEVFSRNTAVNISFKPTDSGEYLVEVSDAAGEGGHTAAFFFSAYHWGETPSGIDTGGTLTLKCDKAVYRPGDKASVTFPAPNDGTVLVSVEKANRLLQSYVYKAAGGDKGEQTVEIPVGPEMLPNAYVAVSIIQPLQQDANDRPLRTYGVIPLPVEEPETRRALRIDMPDRLRGGREFEVKIQTGDKSSTQFTVAVVDEGLLDLTRFKTPDPWKNFFKKQKLGIITADLFSFVIGANRGDIFKLFSIGGDMDDYREDQMEPEKEKRFKPVSMFQGPFQTDDRGRAKVSFRMPDYMGSVRVMVIAANGNRYGSAEKTVPVKTELMVMPTLPRVLGPGDRFMMPVSVFATQEGIAEVKVTVKTEGPVTVTGTEQKSVTFEGIGDKDVFFTLETAPAVGQAAVTVKASGSGFKVEKRTPLNIRPYSPRIFGAETKECVPGDSVTLTIPDRGIPGTNRAVISVMRKAKLKMDHRLSWLIHYPYGCIEQTTSSVLPQLHLKEFLGRDREKAKEIDLNINEGIKRLRRFQLPSGGFAYWPGNKKVNIWGTHYAGHFLAEAKKLGYHVPDDLYNRWLRFEESRALMSVDSLTERLYGLYVLALAGKAQTGPMNLVKENHLDKLSNTQKWMLAAAYDLAGDKKTAAAVTRKAKMEVQEYNELGGTYGSRLRDLAIILDVLVTMEDWNKADPLFDDIMEAVAGSDWYSTQALGYSLLALGKYIKANAGDFRDEKPVLAGYVKVPGKGKVPFDTDQYAFSVKVEEGFGKEVKVSLDKKTNLERAFVVVEWSGVPLVPDVKDEAKNLWLVTEWRDGEGNLLNPSSLKQGTTFWGLFRVGAYSNRYRKLDELALVQILPSGWEIENIRLFGEDLPGWMKKKNMGRYDYMDIRDDRIMWFFDINNYKASYDFAVKLNAVTAGEFVLPPTLFEAMYDHKFRAVKKGMKVVVTPN